MTEYQDKSPFAVYQRFQDELAAEELIHWLKEAGIGYHTEVLGTPLDATFLGAGAQKDIKVLIRREDFERVDEEMKRQAEAAFGQLPLSHYLFAFSNEELDQILHERDQWHPRDYYFAQMILTQRGVPVDAKELAAMQAQRLHELRKVAPYPRQLIRVGWVLTCLPFLHVVPFMIGVLLNSAKKTDPTGQKYYLYAPKVRHTGRKMARINVGLVVLLGLAFYWGS